MDATGKTWPPPTKRTRFNATALIYVDLDSDKAYGPLYFMYKWISIVWFPRMVYRQDGCVVLLQVVFSTGIVRARKSRSQSNRVKQPILLAAGTSDREAQI